MSTTMTIGTTAAISTMSRVMSADDVYAQLGLPSAPLLIDLRSDADFHARPYLIPGARWIAANIENRIAGLPRARRIAVYCARGEETSQSVARQLCGLGYQASYVEGGFEQWM